MTHLGFRAAAGFLRTCWGASAEALGALVFPWECPICGAEGEGSAAPFCVDCRAELLDAAGPACPRCAMPVGAWGVRPEGCRECQGRRLGFDAAVALGPYQGPIRDLCLRLKHEPNGWVAPWLAGVLVEARPILRQWAADVESRPLVVPVPLHWQRRLRRGYNQTDGLARGLARGLGLREAHWLRRVTSSKILAGLGRVERARTMRKAFRVGRVSGLKLKGRTVFLVDDILTTGATCGAAARALKRAGAARVVAVVIGRAEGRF